MQGSGVKLLGTVLLPKFPTTFVYNAAYSCTSLPKYEGVLAVVNAGPVYRVRCRQREPILILHLLHFKGIMKEKEKEKEKGLRSLCGVSHSCSD